MALDCDLPNEFDCSNAKDPNFVSVRLPEEVRLWLLDHAISNQLVRANKPNMGGAIISAIRKYIKVCGGEDSSGQTLNFFTEKIAGSLGIDKGITLSNILDAIANLQESKELAQLAAEGHSESLSAIAAQLGVGFNGDVQTIFSAIHRLKLRAVNDDSECYRAIDSLDAIAKALGYEYVDSPQTKDTLVKAIANLKHSLQLSQNEVDELRGKNAKDPCYLAMQRIGANIGLACFDYIEVEDEIDILKAHQKMHDQMLTDIAKQLGANSRLDVVIAAKIDELQEKAAIADQLQSDLINSDIGELRSERNYYRGILDKLCDRLNIADIEALENVVKYQEMDLDFTSQHNDDLRGKLAESQAMSLKYMNRIVELEREVRSLQESGNTTGCSDRHGFHSFDSDRLSNPELIQIIRSLLK